MRRNAKRDLILTVHSPLNGTGLDESDDVPLDFLDSPPERSAHAVKLDGGKRLEVEDQRPIANGGHEVVDVWCKVYVDVVARLRNESGFSSSQK